MKGFLKIFAGVTTVAALAGLAVAAKRSMDRKNELLADDDFEQEIYPDEQTYVSSDLEEEEISAEEVPAEEVPEAVEPSPEA